MTSGYTGRTKYGSVLWNCDSFSWYDPWRSLRVFYEKYHERHAAENINRLCRRCHDSGINLESDHSCLRAVGGNGKIILYTPPYRFLDWRIIPAFTGSCDTASAQRKQRGRRTQNKAATDHHACFGSALGLVRYALEVDFFRKTYLIITFVIFNSCLIFF